MAFINSSMSFVCNALLQAAFTFRVIFCLVGILIVFAQSSHACTAQPVQLNAHLGDDSDVYPNFEITPDGSRVVYMADQDVTGVVELYSVPIGGGKPIKLNDELAINGDVVSFEISPDGQHVVYELKCVMRQKNNPYIP